MLSIRTTLPQLEQKIAGRQRKIQTLMPALSSRVKAIVQQGFDDVFGQGGIPKWVKLSPLTERERQRKGYGSQPMLVRTGRLRSSYTTDAEASWTSTDTQLIFSSKVPYAGYVEARRPIIASILLKKDIAAKILREVASEVKK